MQTFTPRKSAVRSRHGLVAAQNRHAAEAGAAVLSRGGNAMDAAITTALTLSVVEPWLSGIGGGGFLLQADGGSGEVTALDFNVVTPAALDPKDYPLSGSNEGNWFEWPAVVESRNVSGYTSIAVPGAVAGFAAALEKFGTMSFADALAPAIAHAERGLEIDWFAALTLTCEAAALVKYPATAALLLRDGRAPAPIGERGMLTTLPMPNKAKLLRRLATAGARDFYEGEIARMLVADLQAGGSKISLGDLKDYAPRWQKPLVGRYRHFDVNGIPGLSGGPSFLRAAGAVQASGLSKQTGAADAALIYATAVRDAYKHRLTTMGHAAPDAGCTSHVSVVDARGNMVSLTNTLLSRFGSRVVLPQVGILMNNGILWFDPRPGQPNAIAPGAKPLANMCPLILHRDGRPHLAIGAAGGRTIFPTVLQLISYMADFGLSLEEAFHRPRIDASTPTIRVNAAADAGVAETMRTRFPVEVVEDSVYPTNFSVPSAVMRETDGTNIGMAHPTSPWAAVAAGALPT